ncbi:MAG TPA: HoxN/HupN/NixA family nickel/cobalt transporter [Chthoniobacterales bacterium]
MARATSEPAQPVLEENGVLFNPPLRRFFGGGVRSSVMGIYLVVGLANISTWLWAWLAFHDQPLLLGTCILAYGFGLRHAVDADHIAAIDNVTRKLMQEGKRPVAVGFFFSLGHSSVVVLATAAVALTAGALQTKFSAFKEIGGIIGTSVSVFFLFLIAALNVAILIQTWRAIQRVRRGGEPNETDFYLMLAPGLAGRIFRPLFGIIRKSWHMYPLGFLFGLGFDTATEVALLGISAAGISKGLSIASVLVFPALFTAGMSLVDTTDGVLMLGAYGWALVHPIRKLFYNMTITTVSVLVAVIVGSIEALGFLADHSAAVGKFWDGIRDLNSHFGSIGCVVVGVFVFSWAGSVMIYRRKGYKRLDMREPVGDLAA